MQAKGRAVSPEVNLRLFPSVSASAAKKKTRLSCMQTASRRECM